MDSIISRIPTTNHAHRINSRGTETPSQ
jgi:hypothetical protein